MFIDMHKMQTQEDDNGLKLKSCCVFCAHNLLLMFFFSTFLCSTSISLDTTETLYKLKEFPMSYGEAVDDKLIFHFPLHSIFKVIVSLSNLF